MSELAPIIIVTGTGTAIGKTVTTAAIVVGLRAQGLRLVVVKPTQTGLLPGEPGDLHEVRRLAGRVETQEFVRLADPLAPDIAGRLAGIALPPVAEHAARLPEIAGRDDVDLVLVEGAGGLLVRIDDDAATIADLGSELIAIGVKVGYVVVTSAGLGTLNHSALTAEALRTRGLDCLGFVVGSWPEDPDLAMRTNLQDLASVTGSQLLGRVPAGAGGLGPSHVPDERLPLDRHHLKGCRAWSHAHHRSRLTAAHVISSGPARANLRRLKGGGDPMTPVSTQPDSAKTVSAPPAVIAYRKACPSTGIGLSHYVLATNTPPRKDAQIKTSVS